MTEIIRPDSCPRKGVVRAFDAGWFAHEVGLERATVITLAQPSARSWAVMAWDIREMLVQRKESND